MAKKLQHAEDIVVGIILRGRIYPPAHVATKYDNIILLTCKLLQNVVFLPISRKYGHFTEPAKTISYFYYPAGKTSIPILKPDTLHNSTYLDAYFEGRGSN